MIDKPIYIYKNAGESIWLIIGLIGQIEEIYLQKTYG